MSTAPHLTRFQILFGAVIRTDIVRTDPPTLPVVQCPFHSRPLWRAYLTVLQQSCVLIKKTPRVFVKGLGHVVH